MNLSENIGISETNISDIATVIISKTTGCKIIESSISYFLELNDLELMAVTRQHRIIWEEAAAV